MSEQSLKPKTSYTLSLLKECMEKYNATCDYDTYKNITRDTIVNFICQCGTPHQKGFRYIFTANALCKNCGKKESNEKRKVTTNKLYGVDNISQLSETKEKVQETNIERYDVPCTFQSKELREKGQETSLEKYGTKFASQSQEIKDKTKETNIERYGVPCTLQYEKIKEKSDNTNLERYGAKNPMQTQGIKDKLKQSLIKKYGDHPMRILEIREKMYSTVKRLYNVNNVSQYHLFKQKRCLTFLKKYHVPYLLQSNIFKMKMLKTIQQKYKVISNISQNPGIRKKVQNTNFQKFGVVCTFQSKELREKGKETSRKKYGKDYASQCDFFKEKTKQTNLRKYKAEHPFQNAEFAEKMSKKAYKLKSYIFPSGKEVMLQGYEHFAMNILLNKHNIKENDIVLSKAEVPEIWYLDEKQKRHRHYVDIYIKSMNKCIEVKSSWTLKKQYDEVIVKQTTAKKLGYEYEIWVIDVKGNILETYK